MHTHTSLNLPLLTVNNVSWRVDNTLILKHINVSIERGKFIGLIGPNGQESRVYCGAYIDLISHQQATLNLTIPIFGS